VAPLETTSLRLGQWSATCPAPLYIVDDLLREEGFTEVRYMPNPGTLSESIARGEADFGQDFCAPTIVPIDAGAPMMMLAGVHPGCLELFARQSIRSANDLRGKKVGVSGVGANEHVCSASSRPASGSTPLKTSIGFSAPRWNRAIYSRLARSTHSWRFRPGRRSCTPATSVT
jgi:NitT/TauT family transport system substrate-binding protein